MIKELIMGIGIVAGSTYSNSMPKLAELVTRMNQREINVKLNDTLYFSNGHKQEFDENSEIFADVYIDAPGKLSVNGKTATYDALIEVKNKTVVNNKTRFIGIDAVVNANDRDVIENSNLPGINRYVTDSTNEYVIDDWFGFKTTGINKENKEGYEIKNGRVQFNLEKDANVNLSIYGLKGNLVDVLFDGKLKKDSYDLKLKSDMKSGVYLQKLSIGNKTFSKPVIYK